MHRLFHHGGEHLDFGPLADGPCDGKAINDYEKTQDNGFQLG